MTETLAARLRLWADEFDDGTAQVATNILSANLFREAAHALDAAEADRQELARIDALMARRPALDKPTRYENIEHAIITAKRADAAEATVARLTAERDNRKVARVDLRREIKRAVEAKLPEDEPDCTSDWVYDTAIAVIVEHLESALVDELRAEVVRLSTDGKKAKSALKQADARATAAETALRDLQLTLWSAGRVPTGTTSPIDIRRGGGHEEP